MIKREIKPSVNSIECELERIALMLEGAGYETAFGYREGHKFSVFYNNGIAEPVHSLHFATGRDDITRELVGGFIAYPFGGIGDDGVARSDTTRSERLVGGEVYWYDPASYELGLDICLRFAKSHYADGVLLSEFVPRGFDNPLVLSAVLAGNDCLMGITELTFPL